MRPVIEAIRAGRDFERLYLQKGLSGPGFAELKELLHSHRIHYQSVPVEKLNRLTRGNHQGVAGVVSQIQYQAIEDILPGIYEKGESPFILLADRITDVRNLGAMARTAECAGVHAIVVPRNETAMMNADAMKTSAGALNRIPVCRAGSLKETVEFLKGSGLLVVAITEKGRTDYTSVEMAGPVALLLGSEEDGISPALLRAAGEVCRIPMAGSIASLNVSVAAGIAMYEVVRQRNIK